MPLCFIEQSVAKDDPSFFIGDSQANYLKGGLLFIFAKVSTKELFFISVISHNSGPLLEETYYYPYGLTMAGISSNALK